VSLDKRLLKLFSLPRAMLVFDLIPSSLPFLKVSIIMSSIFASVRHPHRLHVDEINKPGVRFYIRSSSALGLGQRGTRFYKTLTGILKRDMDKVRVPISPEMARQALTSIVREEPLKAFRRPGLYPGKEGEYLTADEVPENIIFKVTSGNLLGGRYCFHKGSYYYLSARKPSESCYIGKSTPDSDVYTDLLRKDYPLSKPTFISRFAMSDLEACFGLKTSWPEKFGDKKKRPKAFTLRDSLRGDFSPLQNLSSTSRLRKHVMESGNNSRMNTIMDELAGYRTPTRYVKIGTTHQGLLSCCGASSFFFNHRTTNFLLEEKVAEDIVKALKKELDRDCYTNKSGGQCTTGVLFSMPLEIHKKYGDIFQKEGWHLALTDKKTSALYFKTTVSEKQLERQSEPAFEMPPTRDAVTDETLLATRSKVSYSFSPENMPRVGGLYGFKNNGAPALSASACYDTRSATQVMILRTRGEGRFQIRTNLAEALALGFVPLTEDGMPYLNGNYRSSDYSGAYRHWLLPMGRVNPNYKKG